jgi:hypothetical protein
MNRARFAPDRVFLAPVRLIKEPAGPVVECLQEPDNVALELIDEGVNLVELLKAEIHPETYLLSDSR